MHRIAPRLTALLTVALLSGALTVTVLADPPETSVSPEAPMAWEAGIAHQLAGLLRHGTPEQQGRALQLFIEVRRTHPSVSLEAAVPYVLNTYRRAEAPSLRLLAVAALQAADSAYGRDELARMARTERDPIVQRTTRLVLAAR